MSEIVKWTGVALRSADALLIESAGVSSSMIVVVTDVAAASSVARSGSDSETMKGSLTSSVVSWVA